MVHISSEIVENFKQMFKREHEVEYSDKEAWDATHNLLSAFEWLLKEDRKQNPENYAKKIIVRGRVGQVADKRQK